MDTGTGAALEERIALQRAGVGDPRSLVGELRRALVLVPIDAGGLWTAELGGVRWICGFTSEDALVRFARARDTGDGSSTGRSWEYAALRGARLLDEIVPAMDEPAGVAINVADPDGAMLFPPVVGIVPEAVAVDAGEPRGRRD
ncbi:SseB family protein [Streptomyces sp. NPDC002889]|uniref:SseB family protein n=1 Tax=Streptomyces sp. NPDC002889 TaxID=3364669 RepID=UPI00367FC26F